MSVNLESLRLAEEEIDSKRESDDIKINSKRIYFLDRFIGALSNNVSAKTWDEAIDVAKSSILQEGK